MKRPSYLQLRRASYVASSMITAFLGVSTGALGLEPGYLISSVILSTIDLGVA